MYRDTSQINIHDCASITDDQTISTYDSTNHYTYKLITNKYYLSSTDNTPIPGTVTCYSQEQIDTLPSKYDFIDPIYHTIALVSALLIFYFAYRLLIYPFFRSKI